MKEGTGLTENLMRFMTDEILSAGSISIGRAMDNAKREYYTHELRYDVFDEKVIHELTRMEFQTTLW